MRRLGSVTGTALVVGNMVGAGVFTTSGFALADLGRREWVLLAWLVGGVLAFCGAISYGALARRLPESGGEYLFLGRVFHPLAGFLAGWVSLLAGFTAPIAVAGLVLAAYVLPGGGTEQKWLASLAIAVAVGLHGIRLHPGVVLQNVAVGVKLVLLAGLIGFGGIRIAASEIVPTVAPPAFDIGAFAVSLVWISFSYAGWNAAVYVAGEVRDPDRAIQRSLLIGTGIVTAVYLALNAVFLYSTDPAELAGVPEVAAVAAEALGGPVLARAVSVLIALALFTSISAMVMAGPRVYARMAADGLFPRMFSTRSDVPGAAVALQGGLALVVVWIGELAHLLGYIGFVLGLSSAATVAALMVLRSREGAARIPIPAYPFLPGLFVVTTVGAAGFMVAREPRESALGLATVLLGIPAYWVFRRLAKRAQPSVD
jgi:APA family basic amino acid/polyamine antiporter